MKCQRRGQREPNCDSARSNCNVVCVDCTWPCATLVAVTMCGTAEATKDHLNEHSLCYSSQLGYQAPSRDRSTRAESSLCRVSVVCQLWQYYAMDMEPESIRAQRRHQHRATYKAVRTRAVSVTCLCVGRVTRRRKKNQTQQAEKNQNFQIPLSYTTLPYHC